MEMELSHDAEEYIEAIYRLQKRRGVAKTNELANELNVVPGSVTNTIEHLKKHSLVRHEPYKGVRLTAKGEKLALNIIRRHRLAERLLTDILNAKWSDVHESACKLEHALTNDVVSLLEKKLGNPKFCPHGNPIPTEQGVIEEEESVPLTGIGLNILCRVAKIADGKRENLLRLASKGIKPGVSIHVVEKKPSRINICIAGKECSIKYYEATNIWVKPVKVENHALQK